MSRSKPEQRACPYCGRRVAADADQCRWCHSDLREPGRDLTSVPTETSTTSPGEQGRHRTLDRGSDAPESGRSGGTTAGRRGGSRRAQRPRRPWVGRLAVLVIVMAVVVAALALTVGRPNPKAESDTAASALSVTAADREALLTRSAEAVQVALSYRWSTFDEDVEAALATMTPAFGTRYSETVATSRDDVAKRRITQGAAVLATGLVDSDGTEAEVLAFVDRSTSERGKDPVIQRSRVTVSLVYSAGTWLISNLKVL